MSIILNEALYQELINRRHYPKETKARVLPYYIYNDQLFFLLCEENIKPQHKYHTGIYNILGGHREPNETILECAQRELAEETINTIHLDPQLINQYSVIKRNRRYIIFLPVSYDVANRIIPIFKYKQALLQKEQNNIKYKPYLEIKEIKWIPEKELRGKKMYKSIQDIFKMIYFNNQLIPFSNYMMVLKRNGYNHFPPYDRFGYIYRINNPTIQLQV